MASSRDPACTTANSGTSIYSMSSSGRRIAIPKSRIRADPPLMANPGNINHNRSTLTVNTTAPTTSSRSPGVQKPPILVNLPPSPTPGDTGRETSHLSAFRPIAIPISRIHKRPSASTATILTPGFAAPGAPICVNLPPTTMTLRNGENENRSGSTSVTVMTTQSTEASRSNDISSRARVTTPSPFGSVSSNQSNTPSTLSDMAPPQSRPIVGESLRDSISKPRISRSQRNTEVINRDTSSTSLDFVEGECRLCMEKESNACFDPCGHICACMPCARKLKICPICRKNIRKSIKTWRV